MKNKKTLAYAYLRLSREEASSGESSSITNQRSIINSYCARNGITLLRVFADDGWSGGNFERPDFQHMMRELEKRAANIVITKDLSRLGRDMRESSYYAEQFFPENGIRYIAISDNFDTEQENIMAPFQFAMNEVYLRDGSRKVRDVLKNKRENGEYCACPPYGYKKDPDKKSRLIPDEMTASVVKRIFDMAASGASSRKIAMELNYAGIIPPLKYRVLYRDDFCDRGAARASDAWNYTTVKRILRNKVYLGHTVLGKSRKASVKSKKKIAVPRDEWIFRKNTHEPLVTESVFERAHENMGRSTKSCEKSISVRKSIFAGIAICGKCGHALCSCGTVYKGEREKYWYLSCTHHRNDISSPCEGVRIRYSDLCEIVRQELNSLISLTDGQADRLVKTVLKDENNNNGIKQRKAQLEKATARLTTIDKVITKLYVDNAEGRIEDNRMHDIVADLEREAAGLRAALSRLEATEDTSKTESNYAKFFELAKSRSDVSALDRETLLTFIERIEVGPKLLSEDSEAAAPSARSHSQSIKIVYKFIGDIGKAKSRKLPAPEAKAGA